jgi:hypothetical protein
MPNVRHDRQAHGLLVQRLGGRGPADPTAVLQARVRGDFLLSPGRAMGEDCSHASGKVVHVAPVQLLSALGLSLPTLFSALVVGEAFLLRLLQPPFLDQQPLPFVLLAGAAPAQDDGRKGGRAWSGRRRQKGEKRDDPGQHRPGTGRLSPRPG